MTEQEWLDGTDPRAMCNFLLEHFQGVYMSALELEESGEIEDMEEDPGVRAVWRKARLFGVACCRRIWHLLEDPRSRHGVEVAEQDADEPLGEQVLGKAAKAVGQVTSALDAGLNRVVEENDFLSMVDRGGYDSRLRAASAVYHLVEDVVDEFTDATGTAREAAEAAAFATLPKTEDPDDEEGDDEIDGRWQEEKAQEQAAQADLLRDLFGNVFRPVSFDPQWLTPAVRAVAESIYRERRWAEMPVLADALEDAGCASQEILGHCRGGREHARGCWVVDVILGKGLPPVTP